MENQEHKSDNILRESSEAYSLQPAFSPVLSVYQMQILDSIASVKDEKELCDIRNLISDYFSKKALDAMDELCEEGKLSTQVVESWSEEHLRTPYRH